MPTPLIITSTRFMDIGVTKVYYLPVVAATTLIPTRPEMNAGIDLSPELADWAGWVLDAELLDVQNINQIFKAKIAGSLSCPDSSLVFYSSKNGIDVRALLPRSTTGFIEIIDGGDVAGNKAEVWPIAVASVSAIRGSLAGAGEASHIRVAFAVTGTPAQSVPVPS